MIEMQTTVNLKGLVYFQKTLDADLRGSGTGPIRRAMRQWGVRYRGFAQERFDVFSKGGGDWKDLAESTKRGRRKGRRKGGSFSILRDTGTLFLALSPAFTGKPGQFQKDIPFGIRVGYGGPGRHPEGKATIADIAKFHDKGKGRLPKRTIIVPPDAKTQKAMADDLTRALERMGKRGGV